MEKRTTTRHATTGKPPENSNCAEAQWAESVENAYENLSEKWHNKWEEGEMHKGRVMDGVEARGRYYNKDS